ncbi:hypothetical protein H4219_000548 [Mycoemilia scoparia]|uniref:Dymeclin n=1 Tax=Mycoemilia scoparia TaxID=417184 RepID=A0A9W8A2M5_9FUNG|nr:hypothetical protein H4219_000548 [Mycoemilia scoparia]
MRASRSASVSDGFLEAPSDWDKREAQFMMDLVAELTFNDHPTSKEGIRDLESFIIGLGLNLANNNHTTKNLQSALFHFSLEMQCLKTQISKIMSDNPIPDAIITNISSKASTSEDNAIQTHALKRIIEDKRPRYQQFLHYLLLGIAKIDPSASYNSYAFICDCIYTVISISVSQVDQERVFQPMNPNFFLYELIENIGPSTSLHADHPPAFEVIERLMVLSTDAPELPSGGGLVYSAYNYFFSQARKSDVGSKYLEQRAISLLLLLICQPGPKNDPSNNPFKTALGSLANKPHDSMTSYQISFQKIFTKFLDNLENYLAARTDPDSLIIPLLKAISTSLITTKSTPTNGQGAIQASSPAASPAASRRVSGKQTFSPVSLELNTISQIANQSGTSFPLLYCWLATILYLFRDETFIKEIQEFTIGPQPWITTRAQKKQPLLLCVITEIIQAFQQNIVSIKDSYIHVLTIGILANSLPIAQDLDSYTSQKLLKVIDMISKRYVKLSTAQEKNKAHPKMPNLGLPNTQYQDYTDTAIDEECQVYENTLFILLTILDATVYSNPEKNTDLIYNLLQSSKLFVPLRDKPSLSHIVDSLDVMIAYFHAQLATKVKSSSSAPPEEVLKIIRQAGHDRSSINLGTGFDADTISKLINLKIKSRPRFEPRVDIQVEWEEWSCPWTWLIIAKNLPVGLDHHNGHLLENCDLIQ